DTKTLDAIHPPLLRHSREGGKITVIPAEAGIQCVFSSQNGCQSKNGGALCREATLLDSGFRRNGEEEIAAICT
ncbi:MAG: hypothetical protein LBU45_06195, partial [Azoarcus sp.]|nr:hypothetical protein [Azoarcus sp.]